MELSPGFRSCLEALSQSASVSARPWSAAPPGPRSPRHKRSAGAAVTLATAHSVDLTSSQQLPDGGAHSPRENGGHAAAFGSHAASGRGHEAASGGHSHSHHGHHGHHHAVPAAAKAVTSEEHRLTGHVGSVLCARVYRGRLLFSSSTDGSLKVGVSRCSGLGIGAAPAADQTVALVELRSQEGPLLARTTDHQSRTITSTAFYALRVWDLETCKNVGCCVPPGRLRIFRVQGCAEVAAG